ncbi:MAG TPA: hypothetical protein VF193_04235 [Steroidobacter sp.]
MWVLIVIVVAVVFVWLLRKNVSTQVDAVQTMADQLGPDEAVWAFDLVFTGLCSYLDDPHGELAVGRTKKRYLEPAAALFQRLKTLRVIDSPRNKGQYRMALTAAIVRDDAYLSKGFMTNRRALREHDVVASVDVPNLSDADQKRVSNLVFGMQDLAN